MIGYIGLTQSLSMVSLPFWKTSKSPSSTLSNSETLSPIPLTITPDFQPMIRIVFWNSLGFFFFGFCIPYATKQLMAASSLQLGMTFSSQVVGGLLSTPIVAYLTDRMSKKKLVFFGAVGRGLALLVMYFGILQNSLILFALGIFFQGFSVVFFWTPLDALISEKSYKSFRSRAFGKRGGNIGIGNLVGTILTILIFGSIYLTHPDKIWLMYSPLIIFMFSNIYAGIIFWCRVDESQSFERYYTQRLEALESISIETKHNLLLYYFGPSSTIQSNKSNTGINRRFLAGMSCFMVGFFLSSMNQSLASPFLQAYLIDYVIHTPNPLLVMLVYFPSEIIAQLFAPYIGVMVDRMNFMIGVVLVNGIGALLTIFLINSQSGWEFGSILVFDRLMGLVGGLILQNILSRISLKNRGKIFGTRDIMTMIGYIIAPIIGGYVWTVISPQAPFIVSVYVEFSLIPVFLLGMVLIKPFVAEYFTK